QPHVYHTFTVCINTGAHSPSAACAERILHLNNYTVLAPDALGHLAAALDARPRAGIAGPRLMDLREPGRGVAAGARPVLPFLCRPRPWLRHRARTRTPYPVSGVMGAALLVTRACYQAVGGFAAEIEVYYEDVDFCLAARARGFEIVIAPRAVVYHDGLRGFAGGLTPWAARWASSAGPGPTRARSRGRSRRPAATSTSSSRTGPRRSPASGWRRSTCRSRARTIRRRGTTGGSRGSPPRGASTSTTARRT